MKWENIFNLANRFQYFLLQNFNARTNIWFFFQFCRKIFHSKLQWSFQDKIWEFGKFPHKIQIAIKTKNHIQNFYFFHVAITDVKTISKKDFSKHIIKLFKSPRTNNQHFHLWYLLFLLALYFLFLGWGRFTNHGEFY